MIENRPKSFNRRAFVALTITLAGMGLPLTGYMNHYYQMAPMTLGRHAWMTAHNILGVIFTVFALWHVIMNRRALSLYLQSGWAKCKGYNREAIAAFSLVALLLLLFVGHAFHVH